MNSAAPARHAGKAVRAQQATDRLTNRDWQRNSEQTVRPRLVIDVTLQYVPAAIQN